MSGLFPISSVRPQGEDSELFVGSYNSYQRAIQYQQLEKEQFGAAEPPGFYHTVHTLLH